MLRRAAIPMALVALLGSPAVAQEAPTTGVKTLAPAGAIKPTGTWGLATRAGDFLFVAGMRGIDPATNDLVSGDEPESASLCQHEAARRSEGACRMPSGSRLRHRLFRFRHYVNKVQAELWGRDRIRRAPRRGAPTQSGRIVEGRDLLRAGAYWVLRSVDNSRQEVSTGIRDDRVSLTHPPRQCDFLHPLVSIISRAMWSPPSPGLPPTRSATHVPLR